MNDLSYYLNLRYLKKAVMEGYVSELGLVVGLWMMLIPALTLLWGPVQYLELARIGFGLAFGSFLMTSTLIFYYWLFEKYKLSEIEIEFSPTHVGVEIVAYMLIIFICLFLGDRFQELRSLGQFNDITSLYGLVYFLTLTLAITKVVSISIGPIILKRGNKYGNKK